MLEDTNSLDGAHIRKFFIQMREISKSLLKVVYIYQTSFSQKYHHFSLLCKQMDIYLRKVYIVRKVTAAPTFLA